jgi:penicillin amidase
MLTKKETLDGSFQRLLPYVKKETDLGREYLYYVPDLVLTRIINDTDHRLYDNISTTEIKESRDDIIRRSMLEAIQYLTEKLGEDTEDWQWGKVHKMGFNHTLGGKLFFLNLESLPTHGSHHTINSGFWDSAKPFNMSSGGVIRMMVDFSNPQGSTIISPPGQSGHYLSPFYGDLAKIWAAGDQIPMHYLSGKKLPMTLKLLPGN